VRIERTNISVIICAYTLDRWDDMVAAVESVRRQTTPASQLVVVIDYNPELLDRAVARFPEVTVVPNAGPQGLSGARNTGLALATGDIVAFLDDDAVADDAWIAGLSAGYADEDVLGVGGLIAPLWETKRPGWFPEEFDWVVGCTYRGMAEGTAVRNLIGANMSMRKDVLDAVGGFSHSLGRTNTQALGDEETGACIRASQLFPGGVFVYTERARVDHRVPASRATWSYYRTRCYGEGISKAALSREVGSKDGLSSERTHAFVTLPIGALRSVGAFFTGDSSGLARAAAIIGGLGYTATGYAVGLARGGSATEAGAGSAQVSAAASATATGNGSPAARRLRVLMVTPRYFPLVGGVEHHVAQVATLMARDADVTVLTTDRTGELPASETVDGVHIVRVPAWPRERDYYIAPRVSREIRRANADIVHVQSVHTAVAPLAMFAAIRSHTPFVLTFHGGGHSSATRESMRGLQWTLLRPLLSRARKLIAVAKFEAQRFSEALGLPSDRFTVIPNGSDLPALAAGEAEALRAAGPMTIVSVGRLERYKGHQRLIEAMPAVLGAIPEAKLSIIGTGPYEAHLRAAVQRLGIAEAVHITSIPPTDRLAMARALAGCSLFALMSDFETHPLAAIEAISLGRPALVADTSGLRELATQGLARAVPADIGPGLLAETILEELRAPRPVPEFTAPTWRECTDSLLALYAQVLSAAPAEALAGAAAHVQGD
jgi:glycosyltransferase involved in cell wall biosynthesis